MVSKTQGLPISVIQCQTSVNDLMEKVRVSDDEKEIIERSATSSSVGTGSLDKIYAAMHQSYEASQNEDKNMCEFDHYLWEPVCDQKRTNPMAWWTNNTTRFPKLAKFVRKHLGTLSTSVLNERVLSTVGLIYDAKRCFLLSMNAMWLSCCSLTVQNISVIASLSPLSHRLQHCLWQQ